KNSFAHCRAKMKAMAASVVSASPPAATLGFDAVLSRAGCAAMPKDPPEAVPPLVVRSCDFVSLDSTLSIAISGYEYCWCAAFGFAGGRNGLPVQVGIQTIRCLATLLNPTCNAR